MIGRKEADLLWLILFSSAVQRTGIKKVVLQEVGKPAKMSEYSRLKRGEKIDA